MIDTHLTPDQQRTLRRIVEHGLDAPRNPKDSIIIGCLYQLGLLDKVTMFRPSADGIAMLRALDCGALNEEGFVEHAD